MIIEVEGVLEELNMGPLELERRTDPAQNVRGGYDKDAAPTLIEVDPVVWHTLEGRDLNRVPEGDRTKEIRTFHSTIRFFIADGGQAADVILCGGRKYRFVNVSDYSVSGTVFFGDAALEDRT